MGVDMYVGSGSGAGVGVGVGVGEGVAVGVAVAVHEVWLDRGEMTVEGLKAEFDPDQLLPDKEQVDSALEALPGNPFSCK